MKKLFVMICALFVFLFGASSALAAENSAMKEITVPVTLTVAHSTKHINVTLPAAMPVSVLDGRVLTAETLQIRNHPDSADIKVAGIEIRSGRFTVSSYRNFQDLGKNQIALSINGCPSTGPGPLTLNDTAFPVIRAGEALPIRYQAKVSSVADVEGVNAANVIFTLKAV